MAAPIDLDAATPSVHDASSNALASRDALRVASSLQIARRLLARDARPGGASDPATIAAGLKSATARLAETLRDVLGDDGSNALFARAIVRTQPQHPLLKDIRELDEGSVQVDDVVDAIKAHGAAVVIAALEAFLGALIDILVRLIGEDMAMRLIDSNAPQSRSGDGFHAP